jgi:glyoxylase-like metal-dependent hydrolase (beta-lactamase superfamily II)/rhodanese-related sulfurtransferase
MDEHVHDVSVASLLAKIDRGDPLLVLDVRNDEEFENWKIEGRRGVQFTHIPYFDFIEDEAAAMSKLPQQHGELIVVCAKGGSSAMVADLLRQSGVEAKNLDGGMVAYGEYLEPVRIPRAQSDPVGLEIWQINRRGKGCLSYVVACAGQAIVIDPSRNITVYEKLTDPAPLKIIAVLETHVHADHVSGGPELAARHHAAYVVSGGSEFDMKYSATALKDGNTLTLGDVQIRVLETPGHTPGSVCYLVADRYLISGDTLFTTSVGRPDLGGRTADWARSLFHTLRDKLSRLSPEVVVLPAHYAGASEIGANGIVSARLADLRHRLPEFSIDTEQAFIETMLRAVRTPPAAYADIIRTNLGSPAPDAAHITEWELGKNQCAAGTPH